MKVAVIGAGIVGLSAARFLSSRGHRVSVYERHPLFHTLGSSHGRSRIVRRAYPDRFYTEIMASAYPLWGDLEAESGTKLLHECGLIYVGSKTGERVHAVIDGLQSLGVPHRLFDSSDVDQVCPSMKLASDEVAIFTPEAGWVAADVALRATHGLAVQNGAELFAGTKADPLELSLTHDAVLVAAGPWIQEALPELPVRVTLQTFAYAKADIEGPVWIDDQNLTYGFPSDNIGFKLGAHVPGETFDPETSERNPSEAHLDMLRDTLTRRFRVENPEFLEVHTCPYTNTASEDFLVGNLASNVFFASACSGHGFKMGPWVGRLLADFAEGKDRPENHPRFQW